MRVREPVCLWAEGWAGAGEPPGEACRLLEGGITSALLYRVFSYSRIKDALSRLFSRCGHVQSVDISDKRGSGEKKDKLTSKFFDHKTLKVKRGAGRGLLMLQWEKMVSTEWFSSEYDA